MKKLLSVAALFLSLVGLNTAHAGVPVIDNANLAQAIQQVTSWAQQLQQMTNQLNQMRQTYNSLNGVRGMGNLVNDINARKYMPAEWQQTMNLMNSNGGQYAGLSGSVSQIRDAAKIMDISETRLDPNSESGKAFVAAQNQAAMNRALGEEGYRQASQRVDSIQTLLGRVNSAPEQKDIMDLQARIQAENAMLQNEQIKLAMMVQLQEAQRDIARQQAVERRMKATRGAIPTNW